MSKAISEVFDVEPTPPTEIIIPPVDKSKSEVNQDADYAKDNIKKLIEIGMNSVEDAAAVARDSESPRAYEVVSTMIKNLTDMNLQLMDIHGKKKDLNTTESAAPASNGSSNITTNNAFFVGTTKELSELIMNKMGKTVE